MNSKDYILMYYIHCKHFESVRFESKSGPFKILNSTKWTPNRECTIEAR